MHNFTRSGLLLFAIPWIVFGIQHYMYAGFVATLVPAYMPFREFWVYFTGTAMIAAGISFIIDRKVKLAAMLLGIMLSIFVLQLHTAIMAADLHNALNWTRTLQDISLAGAAFALADNRRFARYLYALPMVFLGWQHFMQVGFVTGTIPAWLPLRIFWDYLMGCLIIVTAACILLNKKPLLAARILGVTLWLFALLQHVPLLVTESRNGMEWTSSMLDLAIAAGALIIADGLQQRASPIPFAGS